MVWLPDIRVVILRKKNPNWGFDEASISSWKGSRRVNAIRATTASPGQARKRRTVRRETIPVTTEAITPMRSTLA
jgi:hypothetical protein